MRLISIALTSAFAFFFAVPLRGVNQSPYAVLRKAEYFANLYNWRAAWPLFREAESLLRNRRDERNALYAHVGVLRLAPNVPADERAGELARLLRTDLFLHDRQLRLFALTVKGDLDGETDQFAARQDWTEITKLAKEIGDAKWVYRAEGQLGFTDYYNGDLASCQRRVASALVAATKVQDIGAEIFFLSTIANGYQTQRLLLPIAIDYAYKAISLANAHPDVGSPMIAQTALVKSLAHSGRVAEAKRLIRILLENPKLDYPERVNYLSSAAEVTAAELDLPHAIAYFEQAIRLAVACGLTRESADLQSQTSKLYLSTGTSKKRNSMPKALLQRSNARGLPRYFQQSLMLWPRC